MYVTRPKQNVVIVFLYKLYFYKGYLIIYRCFANIHKMFNLKYFFIPDIFNSHIYLNIISGLLLSNNYLFLRRNDT